MSINNSSILTVNGGSSSIKFALYKIGDTLEKILHGNLNRIGLPGTILTFNGQTKNREESISINVSDYTLAADYLINWLEQKHDFASIRAIGHRIVHGMKHLKPEIITSELIDELQSIELFDPDHLSGEIELIKSFLQRYPQLPQIACFDTSFHSNMPRVATLLPIPRRFDTLGIQRYGFHGLSYAYLMEELARVAGENAAQGRIILAHLGSGASMAAVHKGKSMDTSMGFTPAGGVMMGTRPGDLDPGVAWYMMQSENMTVKQFNNLINHESGLLGVSETSPDMQDLLEIQNSDKRAAEAVELFCYTGRKWIGSFSAALGGVDTLVFSGGMGENSPEVRSKICKGLEFLGIELEEKRNKANSPVISANNRKVVVRVIHTDEELMIANSVRKLIHI